MNTKWLTPQEFKDIWEDYYFYTEYKSYLESGKEAEKAKKWFEKNFPTFSDDQKDKLTRKFRLLEQKLKDLKNIVNSKRKEIIKLASIPLDQF